MDWLDRNMQHEFLSELYKVYPDSTTHDYYINTAIAQTNGVIESEDDVLYVLKQSANLQYLAEHGLVVCEDKTLITATVKITAKGIDFLADDGGLSAILGVVTVKLHSDTIQALIAAKIDQAEIPDEEKGRLKTELGKIKDTALSTLTENAINAIPATQLIAFLKSAIGV
ncbi:MULTISPECIES: hypothetical protein [Neisseria]|uniref:hypothetical protein n=1 Tax=Neisseria TaxID=482 RepID=UPI0018A0842E|nr:MULTISPECIES: hypothetical protein [Neisseria]